MTAVVASVKRIQMKKTIAVTLLLLALASIAAAEMYRLENVRRLDPNIYKANGNLIIKTRYCNHYATGEDAIYDDEDKKIIWKYGDSPCSVEGIYK
jgi:hypothetical protein